MAISSQWGIKQMHSVAFRIKSSCFKRRRQRIIEAGVVRIGYEQGMHVKSPIESKSHHLVS